MLEIMLEDVRCTIEKILNLSKKQWNIIIPPTSANEQQGVVQVSAPQSEQADRFWQTLVL